MYRKPCLAARCIKTTAFSAGTLRWRQPLWELANLICGLAGLAFAGDKAAYFKKKLGFPEGCEFGAAVLLGASFRAPKFEKFMIYYYRKKI